MRDYFLKKLLEAMPSVVVNGTLSDRHPGNLNVLFSGMDAEIILNNLQPNVAASTGSACTSGQPEPSHVLCAIGLSAQEAESSVRFSFGRFTTISEIDYAVSMIEAAIRNMLSVEPVIV
jgi:cysteine desulfurase